jgi:uncharacterized protein (DUF58 family)
MSMFFGSRRATKSVVAAEAAALAAWRVDQAGDRVAAIIFDDRQQVVLRPSRGAATVQRVLSEIARLNAGLRADAAASDPTRFNHALAEAAKLATHDWLVVLISDGAGADPTSRQLVSTICAHNDVIAIFIADPLEAALPAVGSVVVAQGAARLPIDSDAVSLRRGHAADFATRHAAVADFGRHRAIPLIDVRTDADVAAQIRAALRPRGHVR